VIGVFQNALFAGHHDKVDGADVGAKLNHSRSPGMRDHGHTKFGAHEQNCQDFVDRGEPAGVQLHGVDGFGLEELLEHYTIIDVLAGRDANSVWLQRSSDLGMAEDVVGRCRLLNKPKD